MQHIRITGHNFTLNYELILFVQWILYRTHEHRHRHEKHNREKEKAKQSRTEQNRILSEWYIIWHYQLIKMKSTIARCFHSHSPFAVRRVRLFYAVIHRTVNIINKRSHCDFLDFNIIVIDESLCHRNNILISINLYASKCLFILALGAEYFGTEHNHHSHSHVILKIV